MRDCMEKPTWVVTADLSLSHLHITIPILSKKMTFVILTFMEKLRKPPSIVHNWMKLLVAISIHHW
ncbi:hypothetical protein CCP3SC1_840005 [Gammaproteobacteria bacterium]